MGHTSQEMTQLKTISIPRASVGMGHTGHEMTRLKTISIARATLEMGHTSQEMTHGSLHHPALPPGSRMATDGRHGGRAAGGYAPG